MFEIIQKLALAPPTGLYSPVAPLTTLSFCVKVLDFCNNFVISQWIYFITHTQCCLGQDLFHQHVAS